MAEYLHAEEHYTHLLLIDNNSIIYGFRTEEYSITEIPGLRRYNLEEYNRHLFSNVLITLLKNGTMNPDIASERNFLTIVKYLWSKNIKPTKNAIAYITAEWDKNNSLELVMWLYDHNLGFKEMIDVDKLYISQNLARFLINKGGDAVMFDSDDANYTAGDCRLNLLKYYSTMGIDVTEHAINYSKNNHIATTKYIETLIL